MHRRSALNRSIITALTAAVLLAPLQSEAAAAPAAAAATLTVDGVVVTLSGATVPRGSALSPGIDDSGQVGSVTSGPRTLTVEAVRYGQTADGEGITATPGTAATALTSLAADRRAQGGTAAGAPSATLFGNHVTGIRYSGVSGADPAAARMTISEWASEGGGRLWIMRLAVPAADPPSTTDIDLASAAMAPPATVPSARTSHPLTATTAYGPTLAYPTWWGGGACNATRWSGAALLATWGTLQVCAPGNGASFTTIVPPTGTMVGFQCVELSLRWMHLAYGVPAYLANGNTVVSHYSGNALTKVANSPTGVPGAVPEPGDVLSIGANEPFGHTAVVYRSVVDAGGNGTVYTLEENAASSGVGQYAVNGWHVQSSRIVIGWLHSGHVVTGDGSFVRTPDGATYRLVGGAPLRISDCTTLGGCTLLSDVADLTQFPAQPVDGAFVRVAETGSVYRMAGGAPLGIPGWTAYGGPQPTIGVNLSTIATLDHLNARPTDGTFLLAVDTGAAYRVVGGAPLGLSSWAPFVSPQPVGIPQGTITTLDHLNARPTDGTFVRGVETGQTYRVAGGAPLPVLAWGPLGGDPGVVTVNQWTIATLEHLNAVPVDGTLIHGLPSGQGWSILFGARRAVTTTGGVGLNDAAALALPLAPDIYGVDSNGGVRSAWTPVVISPSGMGGGKVRDVAVTHGGGYELDAFGGLHPFGSAPALTTPTAYWPGWDIARAVAVAADGHSGYVLDGFGGLHPFGGAPTVSDPSYWPGWDIARDLVLRADGRSGYVLDGFGGIHEFGGAPHLDGTGYWPKWDIAKRLTLDGSGGGYVLDGYGGIHPFGTAVAVSATGYWPGWNIARGITMMPGKTGEGWVIDGYGAIHPFGGAPTIPISNVTDGNDVVVGLGAA